MDQITRDLIAISLYRDFLLRRRPQSVAWFDALSNADQLHLAIDRHNDQKIGEE